MSNAKATVKLNHAKETKGTHQYTVAPGQDNPAVTAIYIQKSALPADPPKEITIAINF